ncbi:unnamed protein product [Sphagnum balticum]
MDGGDVSSLVATAFREHANLDVGMADYRHLAAYFGGSIKQNYCTEFPIDETSRHSSATAARHYANCSNDHRFMDGQQMYTYKLAAEAWHRLLRLDESPVDPPPSAPPTTPETTPTLVPQPDSLPALSPECASLLASLMYSVAQTAPQLAVPPPPRDQTHEAGFARGHAHRTRQIGRVHDSPIVTSRTTIVVVPLTILVTGHEADAGRAALQHATYGKDTVEFNTLPSLLFVSVESAAIPRFVELAHTLNHLQKLHSIVVDEAHLLLSEFRPVMRRLLPLWAVGCQLVALTASLSPSQETDLRIAMSTKFAFVQMSTVRPLIGYAVDEVEDVDKEIIQQIVEWDCDVSSEADRAIVYCFTRQSVERVAFVANNMACVRTAHLHAHLEETPRKRSYNCGSRAKLVSWWPPGSSSAATTTRP